MAYTVGQYSGNGSSPGSPSGPSGGDPTIPGTDVETSEAEYWIQQAEDLWNSISSLWGGGEWPKELPGPMPFTSDEIQTAMYNMPEYTDRIRTLIKRQGHTHIWTQERFGRDPREGDFNSLGILSKLAKWFGEGTGDDLSRDEAAIRAETLEMMGRYNREQPNLPGGSIPGGTMPGNGTAPTNGGGGASIPGTGDIPAWAIGLGVLAVGFVATQRARNR